MNIEISRRSLLIGSAVGYLSQLVGNNSASWAAPNLNLILGRPSNNSIAISLMSSESITAGIEYGTNGKTFTGKSATLQLNPNVPSVFTSKGFSVSTNPTFEGIRTRQIEAYALDQTGLDLYDKKCKFVFGWRLRETIKFDGLDPLLEQMKKDCDQGLPSQLQLGELLSSDPRGKPSFYEAS